MSVKTSLPGLNLAARSSQRKKQRVWGSKNSKSPQTKSLRLSPLAPLTPTLMTHHFILPQNDLSEPKSKAEVQINVHKKHASQQGINAQIQQLALQNKSEWDERKQRGEKKRGIMRNSILNFKTENTEIHKRKKRWKNEDAKVNFRFLCSNNCELLRWSWREDEKRTKRKWNRGVLALQASACLPVYRSWSERCLPSRRCLWSWHHMWLRSSAPPGGN